MNGQTPLQLLHQVVEDRPNIDSLNIISHAPARPWRETQAPKGSASTYKGVFQSVAEPDARISLSRSEFLQLTEESLRDLAAPGHVVSFCSDLLRDGEKLHVPMINFAPYAASKLTEILEVAAENPYSPPGAIFRSGRSFHYYGSELLDEINWRRFCASWLLPIGLVTQEYIGYRLIAGFSTLRMTSLTPLKPTIPYSIQEIVSISQKS